MAARFTIITSALSIGFASPAFSALSSTSCAPLKEALASLSEVWGEEPADAGAALNIKILRVVNPQTGSFSVLAVNSDGVACLIDAGMERKS